MATLDQIWDRLFVPRASAGEQHARRSTASARLRNFANEDILFYVKRIDNSGVVREDDRAARTRCWRLAGSVFGAAVLLILVLMPSAYGLLEGYQIQSLKLEGDRLAAAQASLELEESELLSPARM